MSLESYEEREEQEDEQQEIRVMSRLSPKKTAI